MPRVHYSRWSHQTGSNRRPSDYKSAALPTEAMMANKSPEPGGGPGLSILMYISPTVKHF